MSVGYFPGGKSAADTTATVPFAISSWPLLYRQFGVDQARAGDKLVVNDFRKDCLRELKKIKDAWPDLHYSTAKGALILSPSPPRIAPSQLRLVDGV